MCYLELLTGIRAATAIIPLSLACHYCLFSAASVSASGEAQSRACTSERAPAHTCLHTKLFLTVSLFKGKRLLSCATCGSGPSPPLLPSNAFISVCLFLCLSLLQPVALLSLFPSFTAARSEKNAQPNIKKNKRGTCGLFSFHFEIIVGGG